MTTSPEMPTKAQEGSGEQAVSPKPESQTVEGMEAGPQERKWVGRARGEENEDRVPHTRDIAG